MAFAFFFDNTGYQKSKSAFLPTVIVVQHIDLVIKICDCMNGFTCLITWQFFFSAQTFESSTNWFLDI